MYVPEIKQVMSFQEAVGYGAELDVVLLPYELAKDMEHTREILGKISRGQSVGILSDQRVDLRKKKWNRRFPEPGRR